MAPDTAGLVAAIYNAAWMVRHYARGGHHANSRMAELRQKAIVALGLVVRDAFNQSDDFEALLTAVFDGLSKTDAPPF